MIGVSLFLTVDWTITARSQDVALRPQSQRHEDALNARPVGT
jgi:hypothetical protein